MRYATIEFRDSKAYLGALRLNGHLLDDIEMVVRPFIVIKRLESLRMSRFALRLLTSLRRKSGTDLQVPLHKHPGYTTAHITVGHKSAQLIGDHYYS